MLSDATICGSNSSVAANSIFMNERYPPYDICYKPCTTMSIGVVGMSKESQSVSEVQFILSTVVETSSQVLAKTPLSLMADIGGYLGLILGLSLLDLNKIVPAAWKFMCKHCFGKCTFLAPKQALHSLKV